MTSRYKIGPGCFSLHNGGVDEAVPMGRLLQPHTKLALNLGGSFFRRAGPTTGSRLLQPPPLVRHCSTRASKFPCTLMGTTWGRQRSSRLAAPSPKNSGDQGTRTRFLCSAEAKRGEAFSSTRLPHEIESVIVREPRDFCPRELPIQLSKNSTKT